MANTNPTEAEPIGRKLTDLRVFELRAELQKRNEESIGIKAVLISKLSNALVKEGHNPEEYLFVNDSPKKNTSKRNSNSKTIAEDSDASEAVTDGQETADSMDGTVANQSVTEKTGYEASDIIEDALQLAVDDELNEDREDINVNSDDKHSSKVNSQNYTEDSAAEESRPLPSPPKPETAPVIAPLTIEDKISMDSSSLRDTAEDDASLIVNLDDTQSDLLDAELDVSNTSTPNDSKEDNEMKSNRKSNNEMNNSSDSKSESGNENMISNNEESNNSSAKDLSKLSEKDSSKSKSSNVQKESKIKRESKNAGADQKGQTSNGRNIWVSGLSANTKACELQTMFSKHGKVVSAKIIKNARMSGSRCYGFITMENSEQVSKCIQVLNKTELHGRTVTLSRNRPQESTSKPMIARNKSNLTKRDNNKKTSIKSNDSKESDSKETKVEEKNEENGKPKGLDEKRINKSTSESGSNKGSETRDKDKRKPIRAPIRDRPIPFRRPMIPFRRPIPLRRPFPPNNPSIRGFHSHRGFARGGLRPGLVMNRPDVDRHIRERERERLMREERRRREEMMSVEMRDIEREERIRFEREKERLKLERMRLEREKAEFFKLERERAKLEREKIEREREELRRRQQSQTILQHRVEESRSRSALVASTLNKRPFESRTDPYWEDRKRLQQMQRMDSHILPGRQTFVESNPSIGNRHSISHSYDNRNESYKRNPRLDLPLTGSARSEFDARRHDSRHGIGHDRDERKGGSGPSYYRGDSSRNTSFAARDRRVVGSQRDDWKTSHDSRRSDRYSDKPMTGGSTQGFRYGGDSRGWTDRSSNPMNKMSYGSGSVHMSGGQQWNPSSGDRWNSAISSSSESRSRGQTSLNTSMLSGANTSISDLFGSNPMPGMALNISHSMAGSAGNNITSGDRPYLHSNRRF